MLLRAGPDWRENWRQTFAKLQSNIADKSVVGIFLGDERMYFGVSLENTTSMADLIKKDWPDSTIYQNEAPSIGDCNFNKLNETVFEGDHSMIPKSVDWWGYDHCARLQAALLEPVAFDRRVLSCGADSQDADAWLWPEEAYPRNVFPRLHPHQHAIPVSGSNASPPPPLRSLHFCSSHARGLCTGEPRPSTERTPGQPHNSEELDA